MNTKLEQAIITAQKNGLTDDKLEEFLSQYKPEGRDLSNPYRFYPEISGVYNDRIDSCCTTAEMATFECAILKAKRTLRIALDKERGDWRLDWGDITQSKYAVSYNATTGRFELGYWISYQTLPDWAYLPTNAGWERVIAEVGEPCVKMALFEIED